MLRLDSTAQQLYINRNVLVACRAAIAACTVLMSYVFAGQEVTDASGTVALGQDEAVATSEKSERKPQRRRKLLLEFPSVPDDFSLFPATIMQEHAIIDTRLALAQQRTLHGVDSGANPELCQGVDNIVRSFAIRGPLDCQLLEKALRQEVAKRPVMRLVFYQYRDQIFCRPPKGEHYFLYCTLALY